RLSRNGLTFKNNLRIRRDGKAGKRSLDNFHGLAANASGKIIFRDAAGQWAGRQQIKQRILAANDGELGALAAFEIFIAMNPPVLPFRNLAADRLFIVNLASVRAEVIPL